MKLVTGSVRMLWLLGSLLLVTAALAAEPRGAFSDELGVANYDCQLSLQPVEKLGKSATVDLSLEWASSREYLRVSVTPRVVSIEQRHKGKRVRIAEFDGRVVPGTPYQATIMRRGGYLRYLVGNTVLYQGQAARGEGALAGITVGRGWTLDEARIQRIEPVVFADNFMRTAEEAGNWKVAGGTWGLHSAWDNDPKGNDNRFKNTIYAQNPFAWSGHNGPDGPALCTAGKPYWEDYTFTAAIQPAANGAVGMAVNMPDAKNGLLVRWTAANDTSPQGNRITLSRLTNGDLQTLAEQPGGYLPGQWYKMEVSSTLGSVQVRVDGQTRLTLPDPTPWRGGVGLYVEGERPAVFDDITVYGHTLKKDLIVENQYGRINERFQEDKNGLQEWSNLRSEWNMFPTAPNQRLHRLPFYGDHWMIATTRPSALKKGELCLILNSTGKDPNAGYRAQVKLADDDTGKVSYTLYRDEQVLKTVNGDPLNAYEEYTFRFWHVGTHLRLELDGKTVIEANDTGTPPAGLYPAYRATGCFLGTKDALVLGEQVLDYTFGDAPVDWLGSGTWMETVRWACAPHWSFLAGWDRGDAVQWHKRRFTGDHLFEAFVGLKMEYPREREIYDYRYRDFGITICGDGTNPRSGYTGIFGAPDAEGKPNQRTVLLRNGVEVASVPLAVPGRGPAHREWFHLALHKRGGVVEFWVEGKQAIVYTDEQPLVGGVPAVWTNDNGISLARARLHYAQPPTPRTDPQITIDDPWYPEWGNIGETTVLDFPSTASTAGKPVRFEVTTRTVPGNESAAPKVADKRVTFAPQAPGEHWYQVAATDGTTHSDTFDLYYQVFDPKLGRDDSHTLVLYRFDDGEGNLVHDRSKVTPAADIRIPQGAQARWIRGQGLALHGATPLMTPRGVEKLMALAKTKAATIELWVSTDTMYPPIGWAGSIVAWENVLEQRNFAVGHHVDKMLFAPGTGKIIAGDKISPYYPGFRTMLQHLVITWDGKLTSGYVNGVKTGSAAVDWTPEKWSPDAPLLFGNQADGQRPYLGTYYLVAIHDNCFTPEAVKRHYDAGPSAR